ncbi:MAG: hypothetical protein ABSG68_19750, partial [Thermoguttaceae bacterium]
MPLWSPKKEFGEPAAKREFPPSLESALDARDSAVKGSGDQTADDEDGGPLHELTARLAQLGQLLDEANQQVVSYLVHRESA